LQLKYRDGYTVEDIMEACRLVKEDNYRISHAAEIINELKKNVVPRTTISFYIHWDICEQPALGRRQVG
jgi:histone acetyltransferase (RNA polymerase elongator complex component)